MSDRPGGYEFNEAENKTIGALARQMALVGAVLTAYGGALLAISLLSVFMAGLGGSGSFVPGLVLLLMGVWTFRASRGLKRVVKTKGSDVAHLMDALGELRKLYQVLFGLALTGAVLLVLMFVGLFLLASSATTVDLQQ